jgi:hemerythrin-like metal-binding protein
MADLEEVYGLACPQLDQDHRILFSIIERLGAQLTPEPSGEALDRLAAELVAYLKAHFERELAIMEKTGYPDLEPHRLEHIKAQNRYERFAAVIREDPWIARGVLLALKDWLATHLNCTDRRLAEYLKSR